MANYSTGDVHVICSDDPLLKLELSQELIAQARSKYPDAEFILYTFSDFVSPGASTPNFQALENEMSDPGLFGGERIIKIILKDLDNTAVELFKLIAASYRPGLFIVVDLPRITAALAKAEAKDASSLRRIMSFLPGSEGARLVEEQEAQQNGTGRKTKAAAKPKGKKASATGDAKKKEALGYIQSIGAKITVLYPPEGNQLKSWILERGRRYNLTINEDALDFIARSCDNNLMTINQSLQVMELLRDSTNNRSPLTLQEAETYFTQDARYSGFDLPIAVFAGDVNRSLNIIASYCSGESMNKQVAVGMLINRMEESVNAVYLGKRKKISNPKSGDTFAFFMSCNIKVPSAQEAHLKAIREMPDAMLNTINQFVAEASAAYSRFDTDGAYLALQRMCVANCYSARYLSSDLMR